MKRTFDLVVGGLVALVALPVIGLCALVGLLVWRANPFFVQDRIGHHGQPYRVFKLRSLPPQVPAYADKYALQSVEIPPYGRLLRRLHLDELPQVLHVLSGRMSLVGPRPEMAFLHEQMDEDFARERVTARPGVTGLWQISEAVSGLILEAPEYDRAYLAHQTLRMDAWILWRTALKPLGAAHITLADVPAWVLPHNAPQPQRLAAVHALGGVEGLGEASAA